MSTKTPVDMSKDKKPNPLIQHEPSIYEIGRALEAAQLVNDKLKYMLTKMKFANQ